MTKSGIDKESVKQKFKQLNCCVIIPTYNNDKTIENVIQSTLEYCNDVILINDGCTDTTDNILEKYKNSTHRKTSNKQRQKD